MKPFYTDQRKDYPIQFAEFSRGYIRYLFARSSDSRFGNTRSQDYLAWRYTPDAFGFVISDGVGSSFCGDVAAKFLGGRMLRLLFEKGQELEECEDSSLADKVRVHLDKWSIDGRRRVEDIELPSGLPPLQTEALEHLRREQGSETVFACGRLGFGPQSTSLVLVWMGDTVIRLFDLEGKPIVVPGQWRNRDRWSTKFGTGKKGVDVYAWKASVEEQGIDRIIAFSDGLATKAGNLYAFSDAELQEEVGRQLMTPRSDDISFLDLRLKPPLSLGEFDAPAWLTPVGDRIMWTAVPEAQLYELEDADNGVFYGGKSHRTKRTDWQTGGSQRDAAPRFHHYRVRARSGNRVGSWSQAQRFHPAPTAVPDLLGLTSYAADPATFTLSWAAVEGAQYYSVFERVGEQEEEIYLGPELECTITRLDAALYRYRVQAHGPAGASDLDGSPRCEKEIGAPPPREEANLDENHSCSEEGEV